MKPKGIFDDFVDIQNKILEEQKKIYDNWLGAFNIKTDFMNFMSDDIFKNLNSFKDLDFFGDYKNFSENAEKAMREFLSRLPNYDDAIKKYDQNILLLEKVYRAYKSFLMDANYKYASDELVEVYKVWNNEFIELGKKNFESFMPQSLINMFENFSMDKFLEPYIKSSRQAIDFYKQYIYKDPKALVEKVRDFYEDLFARMDKFPVAGISEDLKNSNKKNMKRYLNLQLKLLEFNLFLNKEARLASMKAQDMCLENFKGKRLEDFAEFYEFFTKELEDAYKELTSSTRYNELTDEILELVRESKAELDNMFEKQLSDLPIMTEKKAKNYGNKIEVMNSELEITKKEQNELARELSNVKLNAQKDLKELKEKFDDFKNDSIRANNDIKGYLESQDGVDKKELQDLKKDLDKAQKDEIKKLQAEIDNLKKELESLKKKK